VTHFPPWPAYSLPQAIERLPRPARRRYEQLCGQLADAEALARSAIERERVAENAIHAIEHRIAMARRGDAFGNPVEAGKLQSLEAEHQELLGDYEKLSAERDRRNAMRGNVDQILSQLKTAVMAAVGQDRPLHGTPIVVNAKPKEGESLGDAIMRLRGEIGRVRAELVRLKEAPLPPDEIKIALTAEIDRLASEGRPRINLNGGRVKVAWPDVMEFAAPNTAFSAPNGSASRLLAWLFRDRLVEAVTAGLDGLAGVPSAERPGLERELRRSLLELELAEESLVVQAIAAGLEVHRRFDTSPHALLGLMPFDMRPQPVLQAAE